MSSTKSPQAHLKSIRCDIAGIQFERFFCWWMGTMFAAGAVSPIIEVFGITEETRMLFLFKILAAITILFVVWIAVFFNTRNHHIKAEFEMDTSMAHVGGKIFGKILGFSSNRETIPMNVTVTCFEGTATTTEPDTTMAYKVLWNPQKQIVWRRKVNNLEGEMFIDIDIPNYCKPSKPLIGKKEIKYHLTIQPTVDGWGPTQYKMRFPITVSAKPETKAP